MAQAFGDTAYTPAARMTAQAHPKHPVIYFHPSVSEHSNYDTDSVQSTQLQQLLAATAAWQHQYDKHPRPFNNKTMQPSLSIPCYIQHLLTNGLLIQSEQHVPTTDYR